MRVDGAVLAFTLGVTLLAAVMFSVLPMLRIGSMQLVGALKDLGRSATAGRDRHRARMTLVVSQVALALLLLVGSGLMARSFARLRAVNPGFDAAHVLTFHIAAAAVASTSPMRTCSDSTRTYWTELAALPGVQKRRRDVVAAALTMTGHDNGAIWVEDHPTPAGSVPPSTIRFSRITDYFTTMHIPLLAGRGFSIDRSEPTAARSDR